MISSAFVDELMMCSVIRSDFTISLDFLADPQAEESAAFWTWFIVAMSWFNSTKLSAGGWDEMTSGWVGGWVASGLSLAGCVTMIAVEGARPSFSLLKSSIF